MDSWHCFFSFFRYVLSGFAGWSHNVHTETLKPGFLVPLLFFRVSLRVLIGVIKPQATCRFQLA